jgi:hypothetical protein
MIVLLNNKPMRVGIEYTSEDVTWAGFNRVDAQGKTEGPIAWVNVTRHVDDPLASKAKRRVFALSKVMKYMKLDRAERQALWAQLWKQMKVPNGRG